MAKKPVPDPTVLEPLLRAAQMGNRSAAAAFAAQAQPWIASLSATWCRRLGVPEFEIDDVAQETFLRLLDPSQQRYAHLRRRLRAVVKRSRQHHPVQSYVLGHVLGAIGFGKRQRRRYLLGANADDAGGALQRGERIATVDQVPAPSVGPGTHSAVEAKLTLVRAFATLERPVVEAVLAVYRDDKAARAVAKILGVSAPTMSRMLSRARDAVIALAA